MVAGRKEGKRGLSFGGMRATVRYESAEGNDPAAGMY